MKVEPVFLNVVSLDVNHAIVAIDVSTGRRADKTVGEKTRQSAQGLNIPVLILERSWGFFSSVPGGKIALPCVGLYWQPPGLIGIQTPSVSESTPWCDPNQGGGPPVQMVPLSLSVGVFMGWRAPRPPRLQATALAEASRPPAEATA